MWKFKKKELKICNNLANKCNNLAIFVSAKYKQIVCRIVRINYELNILVFLVAVSHAAYF